MATSTRARDPLPTFCFKVSFDFDRGGEADMFVKSVSGIRYEMEPYPVAEGGVNDTNWQLPGRMKWSNLVFKQGFTKGSAMMRFRESWMARDGKLTRCNGTIQQLDTAMQSVCEWSWVGGMPVKWEVGDYDASKSELQIESLELAHHGLQFSPPAAPPPKK